MIILDGGLGRELEANGAPFRQPEWSALALIEAPDYVRKAHQAFVAAGAQVITTNSYALVPFHIGEVRFRQDARSLLAMSGKLAREAARAALAPVRVAASIPPMFGSYQPQLFRPEPARQMMQLFRDSLDEFADIFLAETYSSLAEARCFLEVFCPNEKPVWLSLTVEDVSPEPGRPRLRSGEMLTEVLNDLLASHIPDAVLFNCSQPEVMEDAVRCASSAFSGLSKRPEVGVYANAFPLVDETYAGANEDLHEIRADMTPQAYADFAQRWMAAGASIIGGCCGISPAHLRFLRDRLGG